MSTDTYHPKTIWMTQGATHLRCSSGSELRIAGGAELDVIGAVDMNSGSKATYESGSTLQVNAGASVLFSSGSIFKDRGVVVSTGVAQSATLNAWGTYVIDTSGVYKINPFRGSLCTIHIHSTAKVLFKGSSASDAVRFPSSKMRVLKVWCTSSLTLRNQPCFQIFGFTSHRAYVRVLALASSDLANESMLAIGFSTTT